MYFGSRSDVGGLRMKRLLGVMMLIVSSGARADFSPFTSKDRANVLAPLSPVASTKIVLVSEELKVILLPDGNHYRVEGRYTLENRGAAEKLRFGYPIDWVACDYKGVETRAGCLISKEPSGEAVELARSLTAKINGAEVSCEPKPAERIESRSGLYRLKSWCVFELGFSSKETKIATFSFEKFLSGSNDFSRSESEIDDSDRELKFPFFSATLFEGRVDVLRIEILAGKYRANLKEPTVFSEKDFEGSGKLVKVLNNVDLSKMPVLRFKVVR
jgi:hypothetical protein